MGSHVAVMSRGRLEQVGSPSEVYAKPASVFVAQFIGTPPMNILPAGLVEPGDVLVGVRPEHLGVDDESPVRGRVTLVEHLGHETLVHLRVGETPVVVRTQADAAAPVVGAEVGLDVPVMHRHRFDAVSGRRIDT